MSKYIIAPYIGAKAKIADKIESLLVYEGITTYVEPFGGLYGVGLNKAPHQEEIYNELNPKLVHLMNVLKNKGNELLERMLETEYSNEVFLKARVESEKIKEDGLPSVDDVEKAVDVWITLLQSRNGMMRHWKGFSLGTEHISYYKRMIKKFRLPERVKNITVMNRDALGLIAELKYREDVLLYCDSPYVTEVRTSPDLYEYEMKDNEQVVYAKLLRDAKAKIIVSGYKNDIYDNILTEDEGWYSYPLIEVAKSSGNSRYTRTKNREVEWVWMNYKPY